MKGEEMNDSDRKASDFYLWDVAQSIQTDFNLDNDVFNAIIEELRIAYGVGIEHGQKDLEQVAREAFEAGAKAVDFSICNSLSEQYEQIGKGFKDYWQKKTEGED